MPGENSSGVNSYKAFTGKAKKGNWQRSSKKNRYSEKLVGSGVSADKLNFLKEFGNFKDLLSTAQGAIAGGVDGVISSIGSKVSSVFQDTAGNILSNAGDTVKIPPMKKGTNIISSTGNVFSGGGNLSDRIASGAISGPRAFGMDTRRPDALNLGQNSFSIADKLKTVGNALDNPKLQSAIGGFNEPQEFLSNTSNIFSPVVRGRNPLLDFETMNYVLTLSCIPQEAYNNGTYKYSKGTVIAKTGGKGRQGTGPLSYDYYIERLTLRSTVAPSKKSFATNAYQVIFDITEPLGVDLVPALIEASQRQGYRDHLSAVYLLTIDFVGNNDEGIPKKIGGTTRYVPIRLFKVDIDVNEAGSRYNIQAAPYNYIEQLEAYDVVQEAIVHSGTDVKSLIQSFFDTLNETFTELKDEAGVVVKPHLFEFDISSSAADILKSKLGFDDPGASANQSINVSPLGSQQPNLRSSRKVTTQKGTSIVEYLTHVVQNSKFILEQFDDTNESKSDVLSTVKIMPSTEIVALDNGMGEPQYKFVYAIRTQQIAVESSNVGPVRTYNYIYTGQNRDVLNLELKYQFAYFEQGRYYDALQNKLKNDDDKIDEEAIKKQAGNMGLSRDAAVAKVATAQKVADTANPDAPAPNREMADVFRKILENPAGDLIVVDLDILGDPYWIEQKSIKPGNKQMTSDGQTEPDGSVSPDANNIVIQLNAKFPSDLDDETGLMKLDQSAFFQGKFRVFLCESNFEGGVFQQTLSMTRFKEQANDMKISGFKDITGDIIGGKFSDHREAFRGENSTSNVAKKVNSAFNGISDKQRFYQQQTYSGISDAQKRASKLPKKIFNFGGR